MSQEVRERPRLNLKPRDEAAAAKVAHERAKVSKLLESEGSDEDIRQAADKIMALKLTVYFDLQNPFGEAKPREAILADRTGQKEEDILKAESEREKLNLRFTAEQNEKKQALEASILVLEESWTSEEIPGRKADLAAEISSKKIELSDLIADFEKLAVQRAKSGEGIRPSERRRINEERERDSAGHYSGSGGMGVRGNVYANGDSQIYSSSPGNTTTGRGSRSTNSFSPGSSYNSRGGFEYSSGGPLSTKGFGDRFQERQGHYQEPLAHGYDSASRHGNEGTRPPGDDIKYESQGSYMKGQDRF